MHREAVHRRAAGVTDAVGCLSFNLYDARRHRNFLGAANLSWSPAAVNRPADEAPVKVELPGRCLRASTQPPAGPAGYLVEFFSFQLADFACLFLHIHR
jgi:hypothetical protein